MDEALPDAIIEARKELMVSPSSGGNPTLRIGYFLKPCVSCIQDSPRDSLLPHHSKFSGTVTFNSNHAKLTPEVRYNGWGRPLKEWETWVKKMQLKYEYLWIKAGIDHAIKASTYEINRNDELILELAKLWCSETNTFIFPWGEATITLEDMRVCGGYSVMGGAVSSSPLETNEQKEIEAKLIEVRRMFTRSKAKRVNQIPWMKYFMMNESQVEHEGFLSFWLSRFVFPSNSHNSILKYVFPIAIHLARGTRIALAPAVLASIYRDLSLLNNSIRSAITMKLGVTLWAPFQLVQVWALERFTALQPHSHAIKQGQPIMAKWHRVKMMKNNHLKLTLDSAGTKNGFLWRPYKNSPSLYLYNKKDRWVCDNPCLDDELRAFARCLRVSELVGMGCIEQYLPHRVAMQFGMDQDIPDMVARSNQDPWMSYSQPVMDMNLRIALGSSQPSVTSRYYDWWQQSKSGNEGDTIMGNDLSLIRISNTEYLSPVSSGQVKGEGGSYGPPLGVTSKFDRVLVGGSDKEDEVSIIEISTSSSEATCFDDEVVGNGKALSNPQFDVFPSSSMGDEAAGSKSKDVLRGSKCTIEDGQTEDVVGAATRDKDDGNEDKIKSPFCDRIDVNDMEREDASPCTIDLAFNFENRILKLERVIAKIKATRFDPKVEKSIRAKATRSVL